MFFLGLLIGWFVLLSKNCGWILMKFWTVMWVTRKYRLNFVGDLDPEVPDLDTGIFITLGHCVLFHMHKNHTDAAHIIIHIVSGRSGLFILITYKIYGYTYVHRNNSRWSELSINESCNHVICIFSGVNKLYITKLKYKT